MEAVGGTHCVFEFEVAMRVPILKKEATFSGWI
jgi:hypothetical protein